MPVSTGADRAKRCRHCEESGHRLDSGNLFWRIHLDQDLFDTIIAIYPEWFKDHNVNRTSTMAEGGAAPEPSQGLLPLSPPKAEVDDSPLHNSMDKNKESLKVKLMLRRPINQLVAQGIMPPLKTPPAFHEQRQKLERAKMGDLLKAKIQQRPDRQELIRQHILEVDVGHVDPSLAERQRMLKKARLADSLNDHLSHRPGPLELIKKNILHAEEPIEKAVKEGVIPFKATCEGQVTKPQHPNRYITFEEDSQSSEGGQSPLQTQPATSLPEVQTQPDVLEAAAASAGIVTVALTIPTTGGAVVVTSAPPVFQRATTPATATSEQTRPQTTTMTFADLCSSVVSPLPSAILAPAPSPMSLGSTTSSLSPLSSISVSSPPAPPTPSPTVAITPRPAPQASPIATLSSHRTDAPGKDKNRKKSKSKSQPKTRTIKFHEYKGPPNAHKSTPINASPVETSYELLLQQQQLFLQWQLEWQHKYPQIILPASQKPLAVSPDGSASQSALSGLVAVTAPAPSQHSMQAAPIATQSAAPQQVTVATTQEASAQSRALAKLEDMKVSDLKAELKRRSLPVSGSKPQLIERLKSFNDVPQQHDNQTPSIPLSHMGHVGSVMGDDSPSGLSMDTPVSPSGQQMSTCGEDDSVSLSNFSPSSQQQQLSPVSQTMSPETPGEFDMDTSETTMSSQQSSPPPPPSPISEDIIRDQQRKIEELQRQLLHSQLQLQKIRSNLPSVQKPGQVSAPNGLVINTELAPKQQQKLILQQHLQQKKQQQQLQLQLQQLQQQQIQHQQQQQQRQQQHTAFQQQQQEQQQQQQHQQQGLSAKESLAAFLQSQNQQQQLANLLQQQQQIANANNKNNNNTTAINNKKNTATKSIVLGQQQAALVLNQLNLQKQNGVVGHHRTASLPNFFGSFVTQQQQQQQQAPPPPPPPPPTGEEQKSQSGVEPRLIIAKPPPQYEEATKQLKIKQEPPSDCSSTKTASRPKSVKSQIVDDVLEILIKNGELPPSAAQDPATPTTPGRALPQGLIFSAPTSSNSTDEIPVPPPPPPPPLPHTTFAVTLPTAITLSTESSNPSTFPMQFAGSDALDFLLGNSRSGQPTHGLGADLQAPPGIDLKELGLDLETLDSMDFGQLDCSDLCVPVVKMEPSDLLGTVTDMEVGGTVQSSDDASHKSPLHDQLINQQACELMDIEEMPMDMDAADWLESLMPSDQTANSSTESSSVMTPPHQAVFNACNNNYNVDLDSYDPLLSNSQDPFDLFNIEDPEFKMTSDLNAALGWDKVDFAT